MSDQKRRPAECFPVEEYVRDEMEARGWTVADLAERMGLPESLVQDDLDRGFIGVWPYALSRAFGTTAQFWIRLEDTYTEWCAWKGIER